jgi:ABC-type lipoprotein release transport system permease subunit
LGASSESRRIKETYRPAERSPHDRNRLLGYLLYHVSPREPLAFVAAFAVMATASFAACDLPAWRAMRTDPVRALRD